MVFHQREAAEVAARIVVVLAMPTTRTPGRSTSASVRIPEAAVTSGAFDEAIGRPEIQSLHALLIDRHDRRCRSQQMPSHRSEHAGIRRDHKLDRHRHGAAPVSVVEDQP